MKKLPLLLLSLALTIGSFGACSFFSSKDSSSVTSESSSEASSSASSAEEITYTVTFVQEGRADIVRTVKQGETLTNVPAPQPQKGYTLQWNRSDFSEISSNLTVLAVATANEYEITLDPLGATLNENTRKIAFDGEYTLPTLTKKGYEFGGWKNGQELVATSGVWTIDSDVKLTAVWTAKTYEVALNKNDGTAAPETKTVTFDKAYDLGTPEKTGYDFLGWRTTEGIFPTTGTWTNDSNLSLTASWQAKTYTVTFNVNGGNALASNTQTVTYGVAPASFPQPTREGYTFDGWKLGNEILSPATPWSYDGNAELTASWSRVNEGECVVVFVQRGQASESVTVAKGGSLAESRIPDLVPVVGYTVAWDRNDFTNITENIVVEAIFTAKAYTVSLNANGGTLTNTTAQVEYDAPYSLEIPTKEGYKFDGWKGETLLASTGDRWNIDDSNLTLTAQWTAKTYLVQLDADGGVLAEQSKSVVFDGAYDLGEPAKKGYTFLGWFDGEEKIATKGTWKLAKENLLLKASWQAKTYAPTLISNGVTIGSNPTFTVIYGQSYVLPKPTNAGYSLLYWKDENGAIYEERGTWLTDEEVTLTAVWEKKTYTLIFNANGGKFANGQTTFSVTVQYGERVTLPVENPTHNSDYLFSGWKYEGLTITADTVWDKDLEETTVTVLASWETNWTPNY